jgi:hypothetical protein
MTRSRPRPVTLPFLQGCELEYGDGTIVRLSPALTQQMLKDGRLDIDLAAAAERQERDLMARRLKLDRDEDRAAGLLPKLGRPRKFGPRESNGRASRRKADAGAATIMGPDLLWEMVALGRGGDKGRLGFNNAGTLKSERVTLTPPKLAEPIFLNLARRGELDIGSLAKALFWWATKYRTTNKHLLFLAIWGQSSLGDYNRLARDPRRAVESQTSDERREAVQLILGEEFVRKLDAAIFQGEISDVATLKVDLNNVWDVWCSLRSKKALSEHRTPEVEEVFISYGLTPPGFMMGNPRRRRG